VHTRKQRKTQRKTRKQ